MDFLEKLEFLMAEKAAVWNKTHTEKYTRKTCAREAGIPYTTFMNFYNKSRGYEKIKLPTIKKLALYFDCTMDYLVNDRNIDRNYKPFDYNDLTPKEKKMVDTYIRAQRSDNPTVKTLVSLIDKELGIGGHTSEK
jgi:hypothetical protein